MRPFMNAHVPYRDREQDRERLVIALEANPNPPTQLWLGSGGVSKTEGLPAASPLGGDRDPIIRRVAAWVA